MDSLTEREMAQIARQQREAGVQRLSCHFSWPEFCDERRCFHQEFVYDVAMFAAARGFPWSDVIRAAVVAKGIFPRLDGLDVPEVLSLLRDVLCERLPNLTSVHRHEFTRFLADTCITWRRLLKAVVGGAANMSIARLHLELQLPPTPCPLAQVTKPLARVILGEVSVPESVQLDKEGVLALARGAVRATGGQMLVSLTRGTSVLCDIQQLRLQQAAVATGRLHNAVPSNTGHISSHLDMPAKAKLHTAKQKQD